MSIVCTDLMCQPDKARFMSECDWDLLIPQCGNANLLGSLWFLLKDEGLLELVPPTVHRHLYSAAVVHEKQKQNLDYELKWLKRALAEIDVKLVLLKGAAYFAAGLPAARGRMMADIDILVPADRLAEVEEILGGYGWRSGEIHPYDEKYFRKWMHEIPALGHDSRESTLDVHHTILPPTADSDLNASILFESVDEVQKDVYVLSPYAMVIHSASHLFHDGEFDQGMRSLWDFDRLVRYFDAHIPGFWDELGPKAIEMDLVNSLHHCLRQSQRVFATPVPASVYSSIMSRTRHRHLIPLMDFLLKRAFVPDHSSTRLSWTQLSLSLLYIRGHYLRMPLYLLIPHLVRKAWMRLFESEPELLQEG